MTVCRRCNGAEIVTHPSGRGTYPTMQCPGCWRRRNFMRARPGWTYVDWFPIAGGFLRWQCTL